MVRAQASRRLSRWLPPTHTCIGPLSLAGSVQGIVYDWKGAAAFFPLLLCGPFTSCSGFTHRDRLALCWCADNTLWIGSDNQNLYHVDLSCESRPCLCLPPSLRVAPVLLSVAFALCVLAVARLLCAHASRLRSLSPHVPRRHHGQRPLLDPLQPAPHHGDWRCALVVSILFLCSRSATWGLCAACCRCSLAARASLSQFRAVSIALAPVTLIAVFAWCSRSASHRRLPADFARNVRRRHVSPLVSCFSRIVPFFLLPFLCSEPWCIHLNLICSGYYIGPHSPQTAGGEWSLPLLLLFP